MNRLEWSVVAPDGAPLWLATGVTILGTNGLVVELVVVLLPAVVVRVMVLADVIVLIRVMVLAVLVPRVNGSGLGNTAVGRTMPLSMARPLSRARSRAMNLTA